MNNSSKSMVVPFFFLQSVSIKSTPLFLLSLQNLNVGKKSGNQIITSLKTHWFVCFSFDFLTTNYVSALRSHQSRPLRLHREDHCRVHMVSSFSNFHLPFFFSTSFADFLGGILCMRLQIAPLTLATERASFSFSSLF